MQVIGTAGHVDHGKSTLIKYLTGINPDRLKAEQDREMSIELGFAWLTLPNGEEIGIVDVPGHRDFIENMLAGVGGIDAALFVVAADEGVMPQTREHLAIIDLLQIPTGVVALTKIDLIEDPEWLDLVEADLKATLAETILADAPIVRVSARTGEGTQDLIQALQSILAEQPHRTDLGRPRLPVDRVFTLPGFGTIVTGTLMDGQLTVGDAVEVLPAHIEGRIRSLQTHKQAEENALPGGRTAVNISGVSVAQINRGDVIVHPHTYQPTKMMDVWCALLKDADQPLKHNAEVKLFLGAAEVMARVRVLGVDELKPGEDSFLQLMLQTPLVALRQDRFIIRRPSPAATIGGGQVIDPHPKRRHKRFNHERLEALENLLIGTPEEILLETAQKMGPNSLADIVQASGLIEEVAKKAAETLKNSGDLIALAKNRIIIHADSAQRINSAILENLQNFHKQNPLRLGMPREQLKSQLKLKNTLFDALIDQLTASEQVEELEAKLRIHDHRVNFTEKQQVSINSLLQEFTKEPYSPPSYKQSVDIIGEDLITALIETGALIQVGEDVLLQPEVYQEMHDAVINHIRTKGEITLGELRDKFQTSRKYAVAVLEYLDQAGITIRRGDKRVLRRSNSLD
jgi:selenocysteine-specific elongation factor